MQWVYNSIINNIWKQSISCQSTACLCLYFFPWKCDLWKYYIKGCNNYLKMETLRLTYCFLVTIPQKTSGKRSKIQVMVGVEIAVFVPVLLNPAEMYCPPTDFLLKLGKTRCSGCHRQWCDFFYARWLCYYCRVFWNIDENGYWGIQSTYVSRFIRKIYRICAENMYVTMKYYM